jgi:hypothetical protein
MDKDDFSKLTEKDVEKIGFIDRFIVTTNVFNRRYEQSIIRSDAIIYTSFLTFLIILMLITKL